MVYLLIKNLKKENEIKNLTISKLNNLLLRLKKTVSYKSKLFKDTKVYFIFFYIAIKIYIL